MELELYLHNPRSALLLCEHAEDGLRAAEKICGSIIGMEYRFADISHPDVTLIESEKLGIDEVQLILSVSSTLPVIARQRVIVVCNSEKLSVEGQNSLLKLLEENSKCIVLFIGSDILIKTVMSRIALIELSKNAKVLDDTNDINEALIKESCLAFKKGDFKGVLSSLKMLKEKEVSVLENRDTYLSFWEALKKAIFEVMLAIYSGEKSPEIGEVHYQKTPEYFLKIISNGNELESEQYDYHKVISFVAKCCE